MSTLKRKLSSRKFWTMVTNFITMTCITVGVAEDTIVQITGIVMAGAGIVAYILAEGWSDAHNISKEEE